MRDWKRRGGTILVTTIERWSGVKVVRSQGHLIAPAGPPVRRIQELTPVAILKTPAGDTVVDMGQNMVGWVKLKTQGPAGTVVTLHHAEVLDKEGNFYTENLRAAKQAIQYTLKGSGIETFEPHFTFQGFRYVLVKGFPGELSKDEHDRGRHSFRHDTGWNLRVVERSNQ